MDTRRGFLRVSSPNPFADLVNWVPDLHPRYPKGSGKKSGEFVGKGGGGDLSLSSLASLVKEHDPEQATDPNASLAPIFPMRDPIAIELARRRGFDAPAQTVSESKLDEAIKEGEWELLRGGDSSQLASYANGPYFAGRGRLGSGQYFAHGKDAPQVAARFAGDFRKEQGDGSVMRASLKRGSTVVTEQSLQKKAKEEWQQAKKDPQAAWLKPIFDDIGRFGIYKGVDAVALDQPGYVLVLNRGATRTDGVLRKPSAMVEATLALNPFAELANWVPDLHPRYPKGVPGKSGEFISKGGVATPGSAHSSHKVSDALDVAGEPGPALDGARQGIGAIDKVHSSPDMPPIMVRTEGMLGEEGQYMTNPINGKPFGIKLTTHPSPYALNAVHEMGHYLDHAALGSGQADGFASTAYAKDGTELTPGIGKVMDAIDSSKAGKEISNMANLKGKYAKGKAPERGWTSYLDQPEEKFARAYSQYIAERSNDPQLQTDLDVARKLQKKTQYKVPEQWAERDFKPIASAFDDMLRGQGWLNEG